ncbi:Dihydroorotase [Streptomyces violarus]
MSKILIRGAKVLGGEPQDVLIDGGTIAEVGSGLSAEGAEIVEAEGKVLLPGLVDLHTHLREPGREDSETVLTGTRAAASGGYTTVFAMANTFPVADTAGVVEWTVGGERVEGAHRIVRGVDRAQQTAEQRPVARTAQQGERGGHPGVTALTGAGAGPAPVPVVRLGVAVQTDAHLYVQLQQQVQERLGEQHAVGLQGEVHLGSGPLYGSADRRGEAAITRGPARSGSPPCRSTRTRSQAVPSRVFRDARDELFANGADHRGRCRHPESRNS